MVALPCQLSIKVKAWIWVNATGPLTGRRQVF
jgi:hypothetical protein